MSFTFGGGGGGDQNKGGSLFGGNAPSGGLFGSQNQNQSQSQSGQTSQSGNSSSIFGSAGGGSTGFSFGNKPASSGGEQQKP
ncbi:hypothetical protein KC343_g13026, partial [Hortaea werneckii]